MKLKEKIKEFLNKFGLTIEDYDYHDGHVLYTIEDEESKELAGGNSIEQAFYRFLLKHGSVEIFEKASLSNLISDESFASFRSQVKKLRTEMLKNMESEK